MNDYERGFKEGIEAALAVLPMRQTDRRWRDTGFNECLGIIRSRLQSLINPKE